MPSLAIPLTPEEHVAAKLMRDAVYGANITHTVIAKAVNRSEATISQIMNGRRRVPQDLVIPLSNILNLTTEQISPKYSDRFKPAPVQEQPVIAPRAPVSVATV